jgi:peptide-methionine (S)-S-oxide reductase
VRALRAFAVVLAVCAASPAAIAAEAIATFAGGCFWCMEPPFESLTGVASVTSGYTGGAKPDPTYEEVSAGSTGHAEAVQIVYDPAVVSYEKLLDVFWRNVDPTVADRQFCDVGSQYRTAIFVHDAAQRKAAEASLAEVAKKLGVTVKTEIADAGPFFRAEEYHQDYAKRNPLRYGYYRKSCGRDARLRAIWGEGAGAH